MRSELELVSPPQAALHALLASLYAATAEDADSRELHVKLCRGIASLFGLRLAMLVRKAASGIVVCEATSAESPLWLALQRLPERWDGSLVGEGPAARVLRSEDPVIVARTDEDEFYPWRAAANDEGVTVAAAFALGGLKDRWALEVFGDDGTLAHAEDSPVRDAIAGLRRFMQALEKHQERRLLAAALESAGNPTFITDRDGTIVWANPAFSRLSGHDREQIVGSNPRVLQSGRQGIRYYRELWNTIRSGNVWRAETVDQGRNGEIYSILQTISPVALGDRYSHYVSIQSDITRQKAFEREQELRVERDATTQLLTHAAFEEALRTALGQDPARVCLLAISARALFEGPAGAPGATIDALSAEIGDRILTVVEAPALDSACAGISGRGEYLVLLRGDAAAEATAARVLAELKEKLEAPYDLPARRLQATLQFAKARASTALNTVEALIREVDRRLPAEPAPLARRTVPEAAR